MHSYEANVIDASHAHIMMTHPHIWVTFSHMSGGLPQGGRHTRQATALYQPAC